MKTPAYKMAVGDLAKRQVQAVYRHNAELLSYKRELNEYDQDVAYWKSGGKKRGEPRPIEPRPAPVLGQFITNDATVEAIGGLLEQNPRGLLLAVDELGGWLFGFDQYKGGKGGDVQKWLSMHSAEPLLVNRRTGNKVTCAPNAAVSICGGIQPETLKRALTGGAKSGSVHVENGLLARFLIAYPPAEPRQWTDDEIDEAVRDRMRETFSQLLALSFSPFAGGLADAFSPPEPVDMSLSYGARQLFTKFYDENNWNQVGLPPAVQSAMQKLIAAAARLALIFTLIEDPQAGGVTRLAMERGIAVAQWFENEAVRAYTKLDESSMPPEARQTMSLRRLVEWIRKKGGTTTVRDLSRGPQEYRKNKPKAEADLQLLVDDGKGVWEDDPTSESGGRPTQKFRLIDVE
jgi:hypothetical protein